MGASSAKRGAVGESLTMGLVNTHITYLSLSLYIYIYIHM